ncbi:MAG: gamma-glutamyl-gamma-aminobutyrate hydrolase family protein [Ignavibacteriae bacterium]|nr:gamma-glutamyl-gamma-aminobutyrate hydrolase family protein [Ignavibacteriota bacterium]
MKLAVTDTMGSEHKFQRYIDWLKRGDPELELIRLSYKLDNLVVLDSCTGLVLTGGHDIDPLLYGGEVSHPKITDVDRKRDDFERKIINKALEADIPILGICRGLQIVNVHFGGTIIPDIEEAGFHSHQSQSNTECRHDIIIDRESALARISGLVAGNVNSSHHQAVQKPGNGLKVVARSNDGIIEATEFEEQEDKPFFLFIQWHPERMRDFENPLSQNILKEFLSSIKRGMKIHT